MPMALRSNSPVGLHLMGFKPFGQATHCEMLRAGSVLKVSTGPADACRAYTLTETCTFVYIMRPSLRAIEQSDNPSCTRAQTTFLEECRFQLFSPTPSVFPPFMFGQKAKVTLKMILVSTSCFGSPKSTSRKHFSFALGYHPQKDKQVWFAFRHHPPYPA